MSTLFKRDVKFHSVVQNIHGVFDPLAWDQGSLAKDTRRVTRYVRFLKQDVIEIPVVPGTGTIDSQVKGETLARTVFLCLPAHENWSQAHRVLR